MTHRTLGALATLAFGLITFDAHAGAYPVNACVSAKQKAAGKYCAAVLKAWSKWETSQDAGERDAAIDKAVGKLANKWDSSQLKSAKKGSNCFDTIHWSFVAPDVDEAVENIVGAVNTGLDLGSASDAKCGAKLLNAAAKKCGAILKAESKYIKDLSLDPAGTARDEAKAKASAKFSDTFQKVLAKGCPSNASEATVEAEVDGFAVSVVRDTIISPNVDNTQFQTITPIAPIEYLGKTLNPTCIKGTPYAFFAKRGTNNKLLVYYQGGGACWEQLTCQIPVCDASVVTGSGSGSDNPNFSTSGFADRNNLANPFRDWNIVFVSYCSCDVHFGDAAQDYDNINPSSPLHIEHRGFHNSRAVEKWAREHFLNPEQIFVTGSSAGAYGAWFNAPLLHETWPASHFQVLADAGNGVITQDFLATYFPNWNFLGNIPPEFSEIAQIIETGGGIPEYTEFIAGRFPETRWAHYSTAYDGGLGGQTGFYNIMLNDNDPIAATVWWEGSCAFNDKMREQALATSVAIPSNYRYYIGTGSRHTMWGSNKVYNDTTGGVPTLVDWVNGMLNGTGAWQNVECSNCGLLLSGDPRPPTIPTDPFHQVGPDVVIECPSSASGAFL